MWGGGPKGRWGVTVFNFASPPCGEVARRAGGAPRSSTSPPHHVGRWPEGPVGRFEHLIRLPTTWGGGPKGRWGVTVFNFASPPCGEVARRAGGASRSSTSPPHHVGRWPEGPVGRHGLQLRLPTTWGGGPKGRWGTTVFNFASPPCGEVARRAGGAFRASNSPPNHVGRWPEGPVGRHGLQLRLPTMWGGGPKGRWGVTVFNFASPPRGEVARRAGGASRSSTSPPHHVGRWPEGPVGRHGLQPRVAPMAASALGFSSEERSPGSLPV